MNHDAGCSLMIEFGVRKISNTLGCLKCTCSSRSHQIGIFEYFTIQERKVGYELDDFQHVNDETSKEDKIIRHLEEAIAEVIFRELHHKMVVVLGPKYIISPHEPNVFLNEESFFEYNKHGSGMYDFDEVCSPPTSFAQDTFSFQFDVHDPIGIWLENSFMEIYPLNSIRHIIHYMNGMLDDLILSTIFDIILQLRLLDF